MKYLLLFLLLNFLSKVHCQTWQSIDMNVMSSFKIDPYTNNMWCYRDIAMNVVESDGTLQTFYVANIGDQGFTNDLDMAFTPGHTYYSKRGAGYGLYTFDNYISNQVLYDDEIDYLEQDEDTLFISYVGPVTTKFVLLSSNTPMSIAPSKLKSKNGSLYFGTNVVSFYEDPGFYFLWGQNYHLDIDANTYNFQNYTDTLFIGFETGISKAYNGQCYDTITPNNTQNMPSGNVLEIEFDKNDSLWCLFGDANDDPFAIASLHGDTWVNRIDATNSPIDFDDHFVGFEFDTLGNIWVATQHKLHTLISSTSPTWLSTIAQEKNFGIDIYPNPVEDEFTIVLDKGLELKSIELINLSGEQVENLELQTIQSLAHITPGVYMLKIALANGYVYQEKIIKR